jgi:putative lipoprotein
MPVLRRPAWPGRLSLKLSRQIVRGGIAGMLVAMAMVAGCGSENASPATEPMGGAGGASVGEHDDSLLTGTITYMQRVILPRDARVVVSLVDVSHGVSPGAVVAERWFEAAGQVPIGFELPYDSARIVHGHAYGVRAQILVDGALWFINEQPEPVLTRGNPGGAQVLVRPAAAG